VSMHRRDQLRWNSCRGQNGQVMSTPSGALTTVSADLPAAPDVRLRGRSLLLARVACLGATLVTLVIWGWGLPVRYGQLGTVCASAVCGDQQPIPASIAQFQAAGVSIGFYAAYTEALEILFALTCFALAALIFWRMSSTWIGLVTGLLLVTTGAAQTDASALAAAIPVWTIPVNSVQALSFICVGVFLYIFPDGRFIPHWTRLVIAAWIPLFLLTVFVLPPEAFQPLLFGFLAASLAVPAYRYRRASTAAQRQQTKWVVLGVLASLLSSMSIVTAQSLHLLPDTPGSWTFLAENTLLYVAAALIPLSIGIAILRMRLWDIDVLINKALVYGSLTGLLGAIYVGLIIGLETLADTLFGPSVQQPLALVISTMAVAMLFQPMRRRIQRVIDRRFYRRKYNAEKTLAAFSAVLRNDVEIERLREHVLAVIQETMQPTHISLWLRTRDLRRSSPIGADRS
jgi:hypothetical protein